MYYWLLLFFFFFVSSQFYKKKLLVLSMMISNDQHHLCFCIYFFIIIRSLVYYTKNILYNTHGRWQIDFKLFAWWDDRFAIINHLQGEHTQKMLIKGFWTELYNYKPLPACKACDMIGILYVYYGLSNMVSYLQEYRNILTLLVFVWTFFRTPT